MFIDFHAHVLPGVDHGSPNAAVSIQMLKIAHSQGAALVVATPHFYPKEMDKDVFFQARERSNTKLEEAIKNTPSQLPNLLLGAEFAYVKGVDHYPDLEKFCIGDTRYLLIELPYGGWNDALFEDLYHLSSDCGVFPIIAHPDRYYRYIRENNFMQEFSQLYCILQVNAGSVADIFCRKNILDLFRYTVPCILGSDMHDAQPSSQKIDKVLTILEKNIKNSPAKLQAVSEAVLNNQDMESINTLWRNVSL